MPDRALTVEDWHRLNRLLAEALELENEARAAWLAALPPETAGLQPILIELLASADQPHSTVSQTLAPVAQLAAVALSAMREDAAGDRVGPWRLQRLLAEGGMGAVWIAQRADGVMQRTAALKLPRAEWIDHSLAKRIARERAILARLQHPSIAVLYDAGLADGGRPYLALEYVDGVPIDTWCRDHDDLRGTLRLMAQVARAVAYAHGQLVIHRDLKPANVLVTADGHPKLLDFGISKLIEGDATASADATALTRLAGRPLTLAYAAPEQILGLPITVAADVYALGVMLYELITGQRLYRATTPRELEAEVLKGELRRPSDTARDRHRARALRGDLDAIVATALKRNPAERYATAAAFADDLERFLDGRPVRARPDSRTYRLGKFLRRNALAVAAGSAVVMALAAGLGFALWQADEAREQAARATALNTFVLGLIRTADPNASAQTKAADVAMLRSIEERIDHDFAGAPDQLLQLRITVGEAYRNRGEMAGAQRVFQKAVEAATAHLPADDLTLLTARVRASDPDLIVSTAAGTQLGQAIDVLRGKSASDPAAAELLIDALMSRIELAQTYGVPAYLTHDETTHSVAEVEALAVERFGRGSRQHLRAVRTVADLAALRDGYDKVVAVVEAALTEARARGGDVLDSPEFLELSIIAVGMSCTTDVPKALASLWDLADRARAAHGTSSFLLERLYGRVSQCLFYAGDPTASAWAFDAYDVAAAREQPPSTNLMRRAMDAWDAAFGMHDHATTERYYGLAMDNARAIPEQEIRDRRTQALRNGRVCQLVQRGEAEAAVQAAMPQIAFYDDVYARIGRLTPAQGGIWICTAEALRQLGRYDEAIRHADTFAQRCLALKRVVSGSGCESRALAVRAAVELDAGRKDAAMRTMQELLDDERSDRMGSTMTLVRARLMMASGRASDAVELMRRHYGGWLSRAPSSPFAAESLYWFGRAYQAAGDKRGDWMVPQARKQLATSPIASHRRLAAGLTPGS